MNRQCHKMPVDGFKWISNTFVFDEKFIDYFLKNYDKENDKGHIFEADVMIPIKLYNSYSVLPFLKE